MLRLTVGDLTPLESQAIPNNTRNTLNITDKQKKDKPQNHGTEQVFDPSILRHFAEIALLLKQQVDIATGKTVWTWRTKSKEKVQNCPFSLPKDLLNEHKIKPAEKGKRKKTRDLYPELYDAMLTGVIQNDVIATTIIKHLKRRPLLITDVKSGGKQIFFGDIRGTTNYANRQAAKIRDASTAIEKIDGTALFITLTYEKQAEITNHFYAIEYMRIVRENFIRGLKKLGNLSYIWVQEQTVSGYPHFHIIFKWHGKHFAYKKAKNGQLHLKNNAIFRRIKALQPAPIFNLQIIKDDAVAGYLAKYVSKGLAQSNGAWQNLSPKEEGAWRKNALSYLEPIVAKSRQFGMSQNLKHLLEGPEESDSTPSATAVRMIGDRAPSSDTIKKEEALSDGNRQDVGLVENLKALSEFDIVTAEQEAVLIRLLNNLTEKCRAHTFAIFKSQTIARWEGEIGYHRDPDPEMIAKFKAVAYPLGCAGCPVTNFLDGFGGKIPPFDLPNPPNFEKIANFVVTSGD